MNQGRVPPKNQRRDALKRFGKEAQKKESLKIRGRQEENETVWFGLGMFGVVGWSVAVPTLIGVALGVWIDNSWPSQFSWTLMLLIGGLMVGCMNAWYWVRKGGILK
ncbi:MAG: AtpZ/AtpI family protein [Deltaproteobacteria bacterium]|nr:AtpZ/AtpI family protein [Deltaproteobacteria bacterium]